MPFLCCFVSRDAIKCQCGSIFRLALAVDSPMTGLAPENRPGPKRKAVFQPSFFTGYVKFQRCTYYPFIHYSWGNHEKPIKHWTCLATPKVFWKVLRSHASLEFLADSAHIKKMSVTGQPVVDFRVSSWVPVNFCITLHSLAIRKDKDRLFHKNSISFQSHC